MNINFDAILEVALKGVRRAAAFMGLGVNAALDPGFDKYQLTSVTPIQLLPMELSAEAVHEIKEHFLTWIIGSGLRELTESFGFFLDQVYWASTHVAMIKDALENTQASSSYRQFLHDGISGKLSRLEKQYQIGAKHPSYIASINQVRNCLTHRRGIVGTRDCYGGTSLKMNWLGMDMIATKPDGKELLFTLPLKEPLLMENGGKIGVRLVEREALFPKGKSVEISPAVLAEICFYMTIEAREVVRSALDYAKRKGVHIEVKENTGGTR